MQTSHNAWVHGVEGMQVSRDLSGRDLGYRLAAWG